MSLLTAPNACQAPHSLYAFIRLAAVRLRSLDPRSPRCARPTPRAARPQRTESMPRQSLKSKHRGDYPG